MTSAMAAFVQMGFMMQGEPWLACTGSFSVTLAVWLYALARDQALRLLPPEVGPEPISKIVTP